ncbi:DUF4279 domain-containing protein [Chitinimonas sp. PSY-7]|uniref:DUF4279 domain-containing protein n=1 Tax=Chitinimonas sp. PSY-7 TaxID=3459088 RepID=UPI00403FCDA8
MKDLLLVDFQLLGTNVLPSEITKVTGITPNVALMRGERNKSKDLPRQNIWSIQSAIDSEEVADHWDDLKVKISQQKETIRDIAQTGVVRFTIVIRGGARIPSLQIPPEMSTFAGYIGAVIDIDHLQS